MTPDSKSGAPSPAAPAPAGDLFSIVVGIGDELPAIEGVTAILAELWDFEGELPKVALRPLANSLHAAHARLQRLVTEAQEIAQAARGA